MRQLWVVINVWVVDIEFRGPVVEWSILSETSRLIYTQFWKLPAVRDFSQIPVDGLPLSRQDRIWHVKTSFKVLWSMAGAAAPAAVTPLLWCCCYVRAITINTTAVLFYCCCCCCSSYVCDMLLQLSPERMIIMQVTPSRWCVSAS